MSDMKWSLINVNTKKCVQVSKSTIKAGRNKLDEICCKSNFVSRHHANFMIIKNHLYVQDTGSSNGTYVNNTRILPHELHQLKDDDVVGLGICDSTNLAEVAPPHYMFRVLHYKVTNLGNKSLIVLDDSDDEEVETKNRTQDAPNKNSAVVEQLPSNKKQLANVDTQSIVISDLKQERISSNGKAHDKNSANVEQLLDLDLTTNKKQLASVDKHSIVIAAQKQERNNRNGKDSAANLPTSSINKLASVAKQSTVISDQKQERISSNGNVHDKDSANVEQLLDLKSSKKQLARVISGPKQDNAHDKDSASVDLIDLPSSINKRNDARDLFTELAYDFQEVNNKDVVNSNGSVILNKVPEVESPEKMDLPAHKDDSVIEIDDDDDDDCKDLICSQLYSSSSKDLNKSKDNDYDYDDMFSQIKKEVEEMDRISQDGLADKNPVLVNSDESDNENWLKELLEDTSSSNNGNGNGNKTAGSTSTSKPKPYRIPEIIEPHTIKPHTKRKSPVKSGSTTQTKRMRLAGNVFKKGAVYKKEASTSSKNDEALSELRQTRKWKLAEIANKPPPTNTRKMYGLESKPLAKDTKGPQQASGKSIETLLPTSRPISAAPVHHRSNFATPINTTDIVLNILGWQTAWLEQMSASAAPPLTKESPTKVLNYYRSYEEYYGKITPLLTMEMWYSICRDFESESDNKKTLFTAYINHFNKHYSSCYVDLECVQCFKKNDNPHLLKEDDLVLIQIPVESCAKTSYVKLFGYISRTKKTTINHGDSEFCKTPNATWKFVFTVMIKYVSENIKIDKIAYIRVITSITTHLRIFKSVKYLKNSPLCKLILRPNVEEFKIEANEYEETTTKYVPLNSGQKQIVLEAATICMRNKPGIYLIKGPPGTGKTTVITSIIHQILFGNHRLAKNTCILLTAPSNAAIDELALRINDHLKPSLSDTERKQIKLLRVGPKEMINSNVRRYSVQDLAKRSAIKSWMQSKLPCDEEFIKEILFYKNRSINEAANRDKIADKVHEASGKYESHLVSKHYGEFSNLCRQNESLLLNKANIICTTLSSCVRSSIEESFKCSPNRNNCLIVDEATQSQEPETLIPLILGINKVILVGDPQQLPATTISLPAKDLGYGQSLFSRLQSQLIKDSARLVRMLNLQYRMHPEICKYPNFAFYDNLLENSSSYAPKKGLELLRPYLVFNLHVSESYSYKNDLEVECVCNLIQAIVMLISPSCSYSIGVITPYNNQKDAIYKKIKQSHFGSNINIVVNTVDSFQGKEKEIVIMSCVRSDPNNFLGDEKRLNVALTRAKTALYIIGANSLFSKCYILSKVKDDAERRSLSFDLPGVPTANDLMKQIAV